MTVAIIGAGVMGETLLSGLIRAGRPVDDLLVGEKRRDRGTELTERYGVTVVSNVEAAEKADTVALVVKPQDMHDVLTEIADHVRPGQLVVSLAAGITTAFIESRLPEGVAVVRVMPNTPALVDEGMAAISRGSHCDEEHLVEAESLMASTGRVVRVPEKQQDAVTAISGSGPAYLFFVVEAMIEAGVHLGLPRATAAELVVQSNEFSDVSAPAGGQLDVVNTSGTAHTVTADDGEFDDELPDGDTITLDVPSEPGDYAFHCEIHPSMTATLTAE